MKFIVWMFKDVANTGIKEVFLVCCWENLCGQIVTNIEYGKKFKSYDISYLKLLEGKDRMERELLK